MPRLNEAPKTEVLNNLPLLVIFVGESGAGKSTFCEALGYKNYWYVSSDPIISLVQSKGLPINHDTIHACASEVYQADPQWQVPLILNSMNGKSFLLLDGPRRFQEVDALKKRHPKTVIVRIDAQEKTRFERLCERDGLDREGFQRVLDDEAQQTELRQILTLANIVIKNNGTIDQLRVKAKNFRRFLSSNGREFAK